MGFHLFEYLFGRIDNITLTFAGDVSSKAITTLMPVITTGLTLTFITYGLLIIRGTIEMPLMDFLTKSLRIVSITSIIAAGGIYQTKIVEAIQKMPDSLAISLLSDTQQNDAAAQLIDKAADQGFLKAAEAFNHAGFFQENGLSYAFFGFLIILTTSTLTAIGGAYLLLAKFSLSLLCGLAPFFIAALMFKPSQRFFDLWLGQVINYTLLIVLVSSIFGLMMSIYANYMEELAFDGIQNNGQIIGGAAILCIAMIVILMQLPTLAASLSGGFSLGYLAELRTLAGFVPSSLPKTPTLKKREPAASETGGTTEPSNYRGYVKISNPELTHQQPQIPQQASPKQLEYKP